MHCIMRRVHKQTVGVHRNARKPGVRVSLAAMAGQTPKSKQKLKQDRP